MINLSLVFLTAFAVPTSVGVEGAEWVAGLVLAGWLVYLMAGVRH